jgi:ribosomal protein S27E
MPCPTCTHSMATASVSEGGRAVRHCERCGTLVIESHGRADVVVPKLVARVREFAGMISPGPEGRFLRVELHRIGVGESILPPEQRPPAE